MIINYIFLWAAAVAIALALAAIFKRKAGESPVQAPDYYSLPIDPDTANSEAVRKILAHTYNALARKKTPWLWRLSACVRHRGQISTRVALFALEETRTELLANGWDASLIESAILKINAL